MKKTYFLITLRVVGKQFDVKKFLSRCGWKVNNHWIKGSFSETHQKIMSTSGFNMDIGKPFYDAESAISQIKKFVNKKSSVLNDFLDKKSNVAIILDVGVFSAFAFALYFDNQLLKLIQKKHIDLQISCYH